MRLVRPKNKKWQLEEKLRPDYIKMHEIRDGHFEKVQWLDHVNNMKRYSVNTNKLKLEHYSARDLRVVVDDDDGLLSTRLVWWQLVSELF